MKIIKASHLLVEAISKIRASAPDTTIGFVPTMGALHEGHISLIETAKKQSDFVIASIFVNPTQFNDKKDLERYPRTEAKDIAMLEANSCDLVFMPDVEDIYPKNDYSGYEIDLNGLDKVMEGKFRDNHFDGVCRIVEKFFRLINPDYAFFGLKDFQQVSIIRYMVKVRGLNVSIYPCPIIREEGGLAMSSRNVLLSPEERTDAQIINQTLQLGLKPGSQGKIVW